MIDLLLKFSLVLLLPLACADDIFLYPGKAKSERDLATCKEREVCSIVHKRFWFPRTIERFCQCDGHECPSTWSDGETDNVTMFLNNRAQMKFCEPVTSLPNCLDNSTLYLTIENETEAVANQELKVNSKADCYCPKHNQWKDHIFEYKNKLKITKYRCAKLDECRSDEFCGFEREDYYSTYYRCSCPAAHLCVRRNDELFHATEILFSGPAYKAHCQPHPKPYRDDS